MANNLYQWLFGGGGQQPTAPDGGIIANFNGAGTSYGDVMGALNNNRNMIAGLGLGLMSGTKYNPYGNVMEGFKTGTGLDIMRDRYAQDKLPNEVKEYQYAKSMGMFDGTYPEWLEKKANLGSQFGLNPQWLQKPDGSYAPVQLNSRGQPREVPAPGGGQWTVPGQWKDTGTGFQNVPSRTTPYGTPGQPGQPTTSATDDVGRPVVQDQPASAPGYVRKDIEGREAAEKRGQATGTAQVDLPVVESTANRALAQLEQLRNHPGRNIATGTVMGRIGEVGGSQADFISRLDQIKSQAFVSTYKNDMKGGGQISNIEGEKGTKARARLDRLTRPQDFDAAINDLEDIIRQDVVNARQRASGKSAPAQSSGDWTDVGGGVRIRQK